MYNSYWSHRKDLSLNLDTTSMRLLYSTKYLKQYHCLYFSCILQRNIILSYDEKQDSASEILFKFVLKYIINQHCNLKATIGDILKFKHQSLRFNSVKVVRLSFPFKRTDFYLFIHFEKYIKQFHMLPKYKLRDQIRL